MNLFEWPLLAGSAKTFYGRGRYLRLLSAPDPVELEVVYPGGATVRTSMIAGIGVDLAHPETSEGFQSITFTSATDQTLKVLLTAFPSTDSRLTGDVDVNGLLSVVNSGGASWAAGTVALAAATAGQILSANVGRLTATMQSDEDIYIGPDATVSDATGLLIPGGQLVNITNTAELYGYSVAAAAVRVMESLK